MTVQPLVEMQRKGLEPNVITYNARTKGDNAEKALQPWVEMQRKGLEPDVFTYSAHTVLSSVPAQRATMQRRLCSLSWRCSGRGLSPK